MELYGMEEGNIPITKLPPQEMLTTFETVNIAAPMVRYSKLPFRHLVSLYNCHITYTPMMLAKEFSRSEFARMSDFSTSKHERGIFRMKTRWKSDSADEDDRVHASNVPGEDDGDEAIGEEAYKRKGYEQVRGALVAQFAAREPQSFADAVELIHPYVDGVDLNCGCPQEWAYHEEIGCFLLSHPDRVRDIIRAARGRVGWEYPVSVKIRVHDDLKKTEQLVQTAIHAGASYIAVHGRTQSQPSTHPVSLPAIAAAVEFAKGDVPVVANGDAWSIEEINKIRKETGSRGVMSARGLLANPALFAGYKATPPEAVKNFIRLAADYGLFFPLFHRHLCYMLEAQFTRQERAYFNTLTSFAGVVDHLHTRGIDSV